MTPKKKITIPIGGKDWRFAERSMADASFSAVAEKWQRRQIAIAQETIKNPETREAAIIALVTRQPDPSALMFFASNDNEHIRDQVFASYANANENADRETFEREFPSSELKRVYGYIVGLEKTPDEKKTATEKE
jgi:hypothetical protein